MREERNGDNDSEMVEMDETKNKKYEVTEGREMGKGIWVNPVFIWVSKSTLG